MAFDGIVTMAVTHEIKSLIEGAKVDKVYSPSASEIVLSVHLGKESAMLYASVFPESACVRIIDKRPESPKEPTPFCMLLRKHLQGSRITSVEQKSAGERVLELTFEMPNELGLVTIKKLMFEIMGKRSNIVLVESAYERNILGAIKGVPSGINRAREVLPGRVYIYPPKQNKIPFDEVREHDLDRAIGNDKELLARVGGISPSIARELARYDDPEKARQFLLDIKTGIDSDSYMPTVYLDANGTPCEFHVIKLSEYEELKKKRFPTISSAMGYYYENRLATNRIMILGSSLRHSVTSALSKAELKKQRLLEDILRAEDSEKLKLYGELITANAHAIKRGESETMLNNYYDGSMITIPLDPKLSAPENAQRYYKKYRKSVTAITEKKTQLEKTDENISYLKNVLTFIENAADPKDLSDIRAELEETGFLNRGGKNDRNKKKRNERLSCRPKEYETTDGFKVLVGRTSRENDILTFDKASKTDYWLHTKDIPGSHVILITGGIDVTDVAIREAAALAALSSKAKDSGNVPVDYVPIKYVKKPNGAKPGMVIFTHNKTIYVDPGEPGK